MYDKMNEMASDVGFVRRYVDDIIICTFKDGLSESLETLVRSTAPELQFTVEKPEEGVLQFLDIRIHVRDGLTHSC